MRHRMTVLTLLVVALWVVACEEPRDVFTETPPCTPIVGSAVDPCEPDIGQLRQGALTPWSTAPMSIQDWLSGSAAFAGHLVIRATYLPGTVRCTTDGTPYRKQNWRDFNDEDIITSTAAVKCFADVRANEYLVGSGPTTLTVQVVHKWYRLYEHEQVAERLRSNIELALVDGTHTGYWEVPEGGIGGREYILFIGPALDLSAESWRVYTDWDVQRQKDGIVAIHPHRNMWSKSSKYQTYKNVLEMPLTDFTQAVSTAHTARVSEYGSRIGPEDNLPLLTTNANNLRQYYTAVGAYSDPENPPSQPPPPCGLAVSDQANNPSLMLDCIALLAAKDTLRGTGTLNWSVDTAIGSWDGVTTAGTPSRVTKLLLPNKGLNGSIPVELGRLSGLQELKLSGNALTGCIPIALKDVPTNDLSSLNLLYCPPMPGARVQGVRPAV